MENGEGVRRFGTLLSSQSMRNSSEAASGPKTSLTPHATSAGVQPRQAGKDAFKSGIPSLLRRTGAGSNGKANVFGTHSQRFQENANMPSPRLLAEAEAGQAQHTIKTETPPAVINLSRLSGMSGSHLQALPLSSPPEHPPLDAPFNTPQDPHTSTFLGAHYSTPFNSYNTNRQPSTSFHPSASKLRGSLLGAHRSSASPNINRHSFGPHPHFFPNAVNEESADISPDPLSMVNRQNSYMSPFRAPSLSGSYLMDASPPFAPNASQEDRHGQESHMAVEHQANLSHSHTSPLLQRGAGTPIEDVSTMMMRAASESRRTQAELDSQRQENAGLHKQLDGLMSEKAKLKEELQNTKAAVKQIIEKSSKSLENFGSELVALKSKADESFAFATQARSALYELREVQEGASALVKGIEPLIGDGGRGFLGQESRSVIQELQLRCTNGEQVVDLLRDRLNGISGDLAEARSRVTDLEEIQSKDKLMLNSTAAALNECGEKLIEFNEALKVQRSETMEALVQAAESESRLTENESKVSALRAALASKDEQLHALTDGQKSLKETERLYADAREKLAALESVKEENTRQQTVIAERDATLANLTIDIQLKAFDISNLKNNVGDWRTRFEECSETRSKYEAAFRASEEERQALKSSVAVLEHTSTSLQDRLDQLEHQLAEDASEIARAHERTQEAKHRAETLQERWDDQAVTLRLTKQANGDLQERLTASEGEFVRKLDALSGDLKGQVVRLQEREAGLLKRLEDASISFKIQEDQHKITIRHMEERLAEQQKENVERLAAEQARSSRAEQMVDNGRTLVRDLQAELVTHQEAVVSNLREELCNVAGSLHGKEIEEYRAKITELQDNQQRLLAMASNIQGRYESGELTAEEKSFVSGLLQKAQSSHEQELMKKSNELRRLSNMYKNQQERIDSLEKTLRRQLREQAKSTVDATTVVPQQHPEHSIIDINNLPWSSSSPLDGSGSKAPDRDMPPTSDEGQCTPRPCTPAEPTPQVMQSNISPPLVTTTNKGKGLFRRMDTDGSDDFDDNACRPEDVTLVVGSPLTPSPPVLRDEVSTLGKRSRKDETASTDARQLAVGKPPTAGEAKSGRRITRAKSKETQAILGVPADDAPNTAMEAPSKPKRKRR